MAVSTQSISDLINGQRPGHSLQQGFYQDQNVFDREIDRVFLKAWHYACHASQIPEVGDYLLFEMAGESVIIVRNQDRGVSALINVCRHRGSRVCLEPSGRRKLHVCPYHGWTYDLDGALRTARYTKDDFDRSLHGLKTAQVREFHGMIFVNLDPNAVPFDLIEQDLDDRLRPYRLADTKVAATRTYPIEANWKLAVENYTECYHCRIAHPEYSKGHTLAIPERKTDKLQETTDARSESVGLSTGYFSHSFEKSRPVGLDTEYQRYPLFEGYETGSKDGKGLAPLLGDLKGYDGGATDLHMGPMTFFLAYCDHVVIYHFSPHTVNSCSCTITWLVNADAEQDRDYELKDLTWLWDVTTIADKKIIEDNQSGVNSRFYEPGPFTEMEELTQRFSEWYLAIMRDG
jgi:phenylpropionate dioxygenase-like ring-hydroxylating dioxygenase large terminal subunit